VTTTATTRQLPFAHLNLRRNPFGEFSAEDWTRLADVDLEEFDGLLAEAGSVVQFVGEKGYGKTTHLLAIGARFPGSGYVHIPEGERAEVPGGNPLLIDEAQRLTWRQRRPGLTVPWRSWDGRSIRYWRLLPGIRRPLAILLWQSQSVGSCSS